MFETIKNYFQELFGFKKEEMPDKVPNNVSLPSILIPITEPQNKPITTTELLPWVTLAETKIGIKETLPNGKVNPFVIECFSRTTYKTKDQAPWCAAFISYLMHETGLKNHASAGAAEWGNYGVKCELRYGAIVHIQHPGAHVTICVGILNDKEFLGLGGNQSNKVCKQVYKISDLRNIRWPVFKNGTTYPMTKTDIPKGQLIDVTLRWDDGSEERKRWTTHLMKQIPILGKDMINTVPEDYKSFCPEYPNLSPTQRVEFYAHLISTMSKYESAYKTEAVYEESGNLLGVISRGLLQISFDSANGYGCGLKSSQELHDPLINLNCGIIILNRWIGQRDKCIAMGRIGAWRGGARYWSVLRISNKSAYPGIVEYMNTVFKTS